MKNKGLLLVLVLIFSVVFSSAALADMVGDEAPAINAASWKNGSEVQMDDLRGKVVVLEFWATWCPPCLKAIPHMIELTEKYKEKNIFFIGLTSETDTIKVTEFVEAMKMPYLIGIGSTSSGKYGVKGIPRVFIIDPEGKIVWEGNPLSSSFDTNLAKAAETVGDAKPAAPKMTKDEVLAFLKLNKKTARKYVKNEGQAADFLKELESNILFYIDDKKIAIASLKILQPFLGSPNIYVRIDAAKVMAKFKGNNMAVAILSSSLRGSLTKGKEYEELQIALMQAIAKCGKYSSKVPSVLAETFNTKYRTETNIKKEAIDSLGKLRSYKAIEILISFMPKMCPNPEAPNLTHLAGNMVKEALWLALDDNFYAAVYNLTGEKQGPYIGDTCWKYSQWKRWLKKNKAYLSKRYQREQKKETKPKK